VLQEWNAGKIPYYALPPTDEASSEPIEAAIVKSWGAEFDMEKLLEENNAEAVASLPSVKSGAFVPMVSLVSHRRVMMKHSH
jgi:nuclear GTP-binding protein